MSLVPCQQSQTLWLECTNNSSFLHTGSDCGYYMMNCIVPGANIKVLGKALQALSKIGDEICVRARPECLSLQTLNLNKTVYGTINFIETFFASYSIEHDGSEVTCKVPVKGLLSIFKTSHQKAESCKMEFGDQGSTTDLVIKLHYKQDVMVTRNLHVIDSESVKVAHGNESTMNEISASSHLFSQVLSNFQNWDDDISIDFGTEKAVIRNYIADNVNVTRAIRSQIVVNAVEFDKYSVRQETNITFSLKPFRASVHFADAFNLAVTIKFDVAGRPILVVLKGQIYEMVIVIATLNGEATQTTVATATSKSTVSNSRPMDEEREAIESMLCDDDFDRELAEESRIDPYPTHSQEDRIRTVFRRCFEPTVCIDTEDLGQVLAANSDSE